jgi:hypothetical protein
MMNDCSSIVDEESVLLIDPAGKSDQKKTKKFHVLQGWMFSLESWRLLLV